ncbi:unnamed protein product [Lactuca saligna]|uniref:Uncharacterized protein n=1 Tax=Lactuca saligna TaxID=75948 RepID=A0AA35YGW2_LACSI|nr:unnamed protein product [Lactuca saligna]
MRVVSIGIGLCRVNSGDIGIINSGVADLVLKSSWCCSNNCNVRKSGDSGLVKMLVIVSPRTSSDDHSSRKRLKYVYVKYHLINGDGATLPTPNAFIDRPPLCNVGFYLYYFVASLRVPPSIFGSIIEAYKSHTCQLKPNSISKLPIINDSFTYSVRNGSNTQNDEEEDSESMIKVHDSYDDTNDIHTSLVSTNLVIFSDDEADDGSGEQPLVRRKRGTDSTALDALVVVMGGGEGSNGRVLKRYNSLDLGAFHDFANHLGVGRPSSYVTELNINNTPHGMNSTPTSLERNNIL